LLHISFKLTSSILPIPTLIIMLIPPSSFPSKHLRCKRFWFQLYKETDVVFQFIYKIFCQGSSTSCQVNYEHHSNSHNTWNCINMWNQNTASIPISFKISPLVQKKKCIKGKCTGQGFCLSDIVIYIGIKMMGYGICLIGTVCLVIHMYVLYVCCIETKDTRHFFKTIAWM
jgi:hypothetical protein